MTVRDALAAAWRKLVAVAVGLAITWVMRRLHIVLDAQSSQAAVGLVVVVATAVYGAAVNFLELKFKWASWLLGLPLQPGYAKPPTRRAQPGGDAR